MAAYAAPTRSTTGSDYASAESATSETTSGSASSESPVPPTVKGSTGSVSASSPSRDSGTSARGAPLVADSMRPLKGVSSSAGRARNMIETCRDVCASPASGCIRADVRGAPLPTS